MVMGDRALGEGQDFRVTGDVPIPLTHLVFEDPSLPGAAPRPNSPTPHQLLQKFCSRL